MKPTQTVLGQELIREFSVFGTPIILNCDDVRRFFSALHTEMTFHPDNTFHDYCYMDCGHAMQAFSSEEAISLDRILGSCFEACASDPDLIYQLCLDEFLKLTRI